MPEDKRQNETIRIQKKRNNFVMLDKGFLEDDRLSYKAKGILAYLLSKPDGWKVIVADLVNRSKDGRKAVYSGLNELKQYGYYHKVPVRDEKGQRISHWESIIYECPEEALLSQKGKVDEKPEKSAPSLLPPFVQIDNVEVENVKIQNRQRSNNDFSNNDLREKNERTKDQVKSKSTSDGRGPDGMSDPITQPVVAEKEKRPSPTEPLERPQTNIRDDYTAYREMIQDNIGYRDYIISRPDDRAMVDELVNVMLDVILTEGPTVRIGGEEKNRQLVKSVYLKINDTDIEHVIDRFTEQRNKITHIGAYLRTMLYSVKQESDHFYTNRVRADGIVP